MAANAIGRTVDIYADTRGNARCRACEAPITFATVVSSKRSMPFDRDSCVALTTHHETGTHRLVETIPASASHFATCPNAADFRSR